MILDEKAKAKLDKSISRRVAATKANKEKAKTAAHKKLIDSGVHWAEFIVQDNAKVDPSENGGRWVEVWIYVTEEEMKS